MTDTPPPEIVATRRWSTSTSGPRIGHALGLGPLPVLSAATALGVLVLSADDDGLVLCPLRRCTGGFCPGCGGTRAARRLASGDLAGAWSHSPWAVLLVGQCVVLAAALVVVRSVVDAPTRTRFWGTRGGRRVILAFALVNAGMAISIWAARIHAGSIPAGWFSAL